MGKRGARVLKRRKAGRPWTIQHLLVGMASGGPRGRGSECLDFYEKEGEKEEK